MAEQKATGRKFKLNAIECGPDAVITNHHADRAIHS
jgi:hypothetical protein